MPDDARLLLVGEARPYYVFPDNSYYVVFNQNPFFALVAMHQDSEQIIAWLRVHGYTHVLVNWSEIRRLERSYGFNPPITEAQLGEVMAKLTQKEIKLVKAFAHPAHATIRYVDLFQVPAASGEKH